MERFTGEAGGMPAEKKRVKFLAVVLLATLTGTGLANVRYGAPPPDFAVPAAGSRSQYLSQLRGKPVVINFWASWCPPCTDELPYFQRLISQYGDRIRLITVDWDEDPGVAARYLRDKHLNLPLMRDSSGRIYDLYSLTKVPDTIVLDANGNVTYVSVGGLSWTELKNAVDQDLPGARSSQEGP
jgi:cytochrome c biogenesis protein CcmG/thiol:disulfide interchange protein DsbE